MAGAGGLSFAMATAAKRMTDTHARKDAINVVALSDMRALEVACVSIRQSLIAVGDFQSVIQAVASGATYANVHTTAHPGGEIRGRIRATHDEDDEPAKLTLLLGCQPRSGEAFYFWYGLT